MILHIKRDFSMFWTGASLSKNQYNLNPLDLNPNFCLTRVDALTARVTVMEEDTRDGMQVLDETTDYLRYAIMELGGFVHERVFSGHTCSSKSVPMVQFGRCANVLLIQQMGQETRCQKQKNLIPSRKMGLHLCVLHCRDFWTI